MLMDLIGIVLGDDVKVLIMLKVLRALIKRLGSFTKLIRYVRFIEYYLVTIISN